MLALLQGHVPAHDASPEAAGDALRRLDCGGYLRSLWTPADGTRRLPPGWAEALERAYRKTLVDTLAALADFRAFGRLLVEEGVSFVLLKGSAYLNDLYADPGQRALTDIDLLIRPEDAIRLVQRLLRAGYKTLQWDDEYRKFEVIPPGPHRCSFEVHWRLGMSEFAIDQERIRERARDTSLEEIPCRRLAPEDALLYHVAHMADHFFGPSLKWIIDLQLMCRRWPLDPAILVSRASDWHVRTALSLGMEHLRKVLPAAAPAGLEGSVALGPWRRRLVRRYLDPGPVALMNVGNGTLSRYTARCLLLDRPSDVLRGFTRAVKRPFVRFLGSRRADGAPPPQWR